MKFLIHSNAPTAKTGYGVQVALLCDRLAADGHDVAVSANWGQEATIGVWRSPSGYDINVYPHGQTRDMLHWHALHHFGGNARGGWIIVLLDVWGVTNPHLPTFNVLAWTPVDHHPVPPGVIQFFERSKALPVAMSRHGQSELPDSRYVPLAIDTSVYKPTFTSQDGTTTARELFHLPADAFVVGMVAMNKDPGDRKGFNEALRGFAAFQRRHRNAVLFVYTDPLGLGLNLYELAASCGIPSTSIVFPESFPYDLGLTPSHMAAAYTAMDVLLAPSAGEGFCVPLIEAQACGTPVICSEFTAQTELVGNGWLLAGQLQWDQASRSNYFRAYIPDIVAKLELAYDAELERMQNDCREFAATYDADYIFATYWRKLVASLEVQLPTKPKMDTVDVVVPVLNRPGNVKPLVESFNATNDGTARLYFVTDPDDDAENDEIRRHVSDRVVLLHTDRGSSFSCKVNSAFAQTAGDWVLLAGDDCEFTAGYLDAARQLSDRFDVIGTNDSEPGRVRNQNVANGSHADHFFVRRAYVDDVGACLDGPGVLAPEAYGHWHTDQEIIQMAKARGVFTPCLDSRVIHHHPGFDGREDLRHNDPTYMRAVALAEADAITFSKRAPLIDQHKVVAGGIW